MISILPLLVFIVLAGATCAKIEFSFWPTEKSINRNVILVVEGYGENQKIVVGTAI